MKHPVGEIVFINIRIRTSVFACVLKNVPYAVLWPYKAYKCLEK